jgi:hypothetical protein
MTIKRTASLLFFLAGVAALAAVALAQTGSLFVKSPAGSELVAVIPTSPFPTGMNQQVYLAQIRDAAGYQKLVPTSGQTLTVNNYVSVVQLTPAAGLSALTFNTPLAPVDGQRLRFFTTQTITTFNLTASAGQTVNGNLGGSFSSNSAVEYLYSASNTTWDRIL